MRPSKAGATKSASFPAEIAVDLQHLDKTTARWRAGGISNAAYAGLYFLHWQADSHGKRFASRRRRADPRPDPVAWFEDTASLDAEETDAYLLRYFERYQFLGVIGNVPLALAAWLRAEWPLTLCQHIPSPVEVLHMQVDGTRPVTLLSGWPRMLAPVLSKPNAFAFMVHDLEHAWKFFHDPDMHRQQRELFRLLSAALVAGRFDGYLADPLFAAKFDYLSADMNTHLMHASQFLRAILVEFYLRQEGLQNPEDLSGTARETISAFLAGLFGADWVDEVERRMIRGCGVF